MTTLTIEALQERVDRGIPTTTEEVAEFLSNEIRTFVLDSIARATDQLRGEFRAQLAGLAAAGGADPTSRALAPSWRGIFTMGSAYPADALVAYKHGLYVARRATVLEPGNSDDWQLIVRRPR